MSAEPHNVARFLRRWAHERPDQPAMHFPRSGAWQRRPAWDTLTFAELDRDSDALAHGLRGLGVRRGDRTVVLFRPSLDFYALFFALFKLGAVPVVLDPGMGLSALLRCIERTRPRVLVGAPAVQVVRLLHPRPFAAVEIAVAAGGPWPFGPHLDALRRDEGPFPLEPMGPDDDAAILFTSGSTGPAKGVTSTQAMFAAQVEALSAMLRFEPGWTDAQAFAAFAVFDLCMGLTSAIHPMDLARPGSADPARIAATFHAFRPEVAFASPIVWQRLSRWAADRGERFESLKAVITVGAPIPPGLLRRCLGMLGPDARMLTPYGATEGLPLTYVDSREILDEAWEQTARGAGVCVGRPAPGAEVHIVGITDDPLPTWSDDLALGPGELGEIVVGGPQVSPAYKDAPDANAASKIRRGERVLHRTGDLGVLDARGRLWFHGRKAHRLETAEGVLPSVPLEAVYDEHPDVFRTALVGIGPRGREIPVVCVEMEPGRRFGPDVEAALRQLEAGTPWAGRVRRFLPHPGLPTDARHNSKIRREDLVPWVEARCRDLLREVG